MLVFDLFINVVLITAGSVRFVFVGCVVICFAYSC